jgi:hypothetical protein
MRCDAAIVFAKGLSGEWQRTESVALVSAIARVDPETAIDDWLEHEESSHDRTTIATWRQYGQRWLTFFGTDLRAINVRTLSKFMSERLRHVLAKTVRKELSALRGLLSWAVEHEAGKPTRRRCGAGCLFGGAVGGTIPTGPTEWTALCR